MKTSAIITLILSATWCAAQQAPNDPEWRGCITDAESRIQRSEYRSAESLLLQAHRLAKAFEVNDPRRAYTVMRMADLYARDKRRDKARSLYEKAAAVFESHERDSVEQYAYCIAQLADLDCREGHHAAALAGFQKSTQILQDADRADHSQMTQSLFGMARCYRLMEKHDLSEACFQRCLGLIKVQGDSPDNMGHILAEYARLHWAKGNLPKADQLFTQAHQHAVAKRGPAHREVADILQSHANLAKLRKRPDVAKQMISKAQQIYQNVH
jgi:tetratricopeptide (TPR) repeat protein